MRLIVTADDVGLHEGMNAGAVRAHQHGIVTSCSVVANGSALSDAIARLKECPRMSAGAHLTLVEERPVAGTQNVRSLVGSDGRFFRNFKSFAARYALGTIRISEVESELRAQIEKLLESGLQLVHLNGHQHLHVLPRIFDVVLRLAEEYRIHYVRIPSDAIAPGIASGRAASMKILNVFGARARRRGASVAKSVATIGISSAGHLTPARLISLFDHMNGATAELVCHPGTDDVRIARTYDWGYHWDRETATLCDPAVRDALEARGIELVTPEMIG